MCSIHPPRTNIVPLNSKASSKNSIKNGSANDPAAVPERQNAFAIPRLLSKYRAVRITPGVVDNPTPTPVKIPNETKSSYI